MEKWSELPNDSSHVSAPTSPGRSFSLNRTVSFYSEPNTPIRHIVSTPFRTEPKPTTDEGVNSNFDDFEFETSRQFDDFEFETSQDFEHQPRCRGESLPCMAFADELFCGGQVRPLKLKLKLPPRLQNVSASKHCGNHGSVAFSPRSVLKAAFSGGALWNDDYDPFVAAIENVREEIKEGRDQGNSRRRRARSLSPLRTKELESLDQNNQVSSPKPPAQQRGLNQNGLHQNGPMEPDGLAPAGWELEQCNEMGPQEWVQKVGSGPNKRAGFRGAAFARRVRAMRMGHGWSNGPSPGPTVKAGESGRCCAEETRSHRFKKFLFRNASVGRQRKEKNQSDPTSALWLPNYLGRFSFKSVGASAHSNLKKKAPGEIRMALMQHRPRLFVCMGLSFRRRRNVN